MCPFPPAMLKKLYVQGSLRTDQDGFTLDLTNVLAPGTIVACEGLDLDGQPVDPARVTLIPPTGHPRQADKISDQAPIPFPLNKKLTLHTAGEPPTPGPHTLAIHITVREIGPIEITITDTVE